MNPLARFLLLATFTAFASAKLHHLFVGNLVSPASIHAFEFDDETLILRETNTIAASAPYSWVAFDRAKRNVYGATQNKSAISSYSILNNSSLRLDADILASGKCAGKTSAFVLPSLDGTVYTASWPGPSGCGAAISVYPNGTLKEMISTWNYANESTVHGLGLHDQLLYSADLTGDSIWTHKVGRDGEIHELDRFEMPKNGTHPRHLVAHPKGKYLYAIMEAANELREYALDNENGVPKTQSATYSLIPRGYNNSAYWSCEVALSPSRRFLWATSRAQVNTNNFGYISGFALREDGSIKKKIFMVPTKTRGGIANTITTAFFSDEWMAMTDFTPGANGYLQIWRMKNEDGSGRITAEAIAKADVEDGGCCANAIWYD